MLTTKNSPPFAAPLCFFLSAPLFGIALGVLLLFYPDAIFTSRYLPETLAAVHLCTVGFMLQIMLGALIQILPVTAGAVIQKPLGIASVVHALFNIGAIFLVLAFFEQSNSLMIAAIIVLFLAATILFVSLFLAFHKTQTFSGPVLGLKLAVIALFFTLSLGIILGGTQSHFIYLIKDWTNLHAAWGLIGWGAILLISVSFIVVPMFQLTPNYPNLFSWILPAFLFSLLLLLTIATFFEIEIINTVLILLMFLGLLSFVILTLKLQQKRRRARRDPTFYAWAFGLWVCCIAFVFFILHFLFFEDLEKYQIPTNAVIFILYAFVAFICGMLFKIMPFLSWLHLQNIALGKYKIPAMNYYLNEKEAYIQICIYFVSAVFLFLSVFIPFFRISAAILIILQFLVLEFLLIAAFLRYKKILKDLIKQKRENPR